MQKDEIYFLKIRGVNNMPDYVQVRDDNFTLIAYFRADKPETARVSCGRNLSGSALTQAIQNLPYGIIKKYDIS